MVDKRNVNNFVNHGIPVDAEESRTGAVCTNQAGENRIVLAAKGFVVIVDPVAERSVQVFFPEGNREYPYASFSDSLGNFYTGAGRMFMMLDPFREAFIYYERIGRLDELLSFSFEEDELQGDIYFTAYPTSHLYKFNRTSKKTTLVVRLDDGQMYPSHLALGEDGWLYAGVGTERKTIVAYHLVSGVLNSLVPAGERTRGMGVVHRGKDGAVYGHWNYQDLRESKAPSSLQWYRLHNGSAVPIPYEEVVNSFYQGDGFHRLHRQLKGELQVESFELAERELNFRDSEGGHRQMKLEFVTEGTRLSSLTAGADGMVYGTSMHPLHFYQFDPRSGSFHDYGGKPIELGGGGNIAAYAVSGSYIGGAAYAGGHFHLFDVRLPVTSGQLRSNPRRVCSHLDIHRPRCALALSDGVHMVYGGFPGYGMVGGGLCFYSLELDQDRLYTHEQLIPFHSTLCLVEKSAHCLIGGTSVETHGGAVPVDSSARIYEFDWHQGVVNHSWQPVPEAREYIWVDLDEAGRLHGLSSKSIYFVMELDSGEVVARQDLSSWGYPVNCGMHRYTSDQVLGVLNHAVISISLSTTQVTRLDSTPEEITAGLAVLNQTMYMAAGNQLWSYPLATK